MSYLIPAGSEAHDFQPSTKNVADIEKADTFVYLNENMETWVPKVEKSINTKNTKVIKASQGMVLLPGTEEEDHDRWWRKNITTNMILMFGSHLNVLKN